MKILIFDDSIQEAKHLVDCLDYFFDSLKMKYEYKIINEITDDINFNESDLIFLDVEIKERNGIDFGKTIRNANCNVPIILTTNYKQYALDGYKIKAERYFLKPIDKEELCIELKEVLNNYISDTKYIDDEKLYNRRLYYKDIVYIESLAHKTYLHLRNKETISSSKSLKEWIELTNQIYFSQIHKAFLVNLRYVKSFDAKEITLTDNSILYLSRHYRENFEDDYKHYLVQGA